MNWTPEQITNLIVQIGATVGAVTGAIVTVVKLAQNNKDASDHLAESTPQDVTHKIIDNANSAQIAAASNSGGTTLEIKPPAEIDVKSTGT